MVSKEEIVDIRKASLRRQQQRKRGETQPCLEALMNAADYVNDKFLVATDDDAVDSARDEKLAKVKINADERAAAGEWEKAFGVQGDYIAGLDAKVVRLEQEVEKGTELKECVRVLCTAIDDRDVEVEKHEASLQAQVQKANELCCALNDLKKEASAKLKEERAVTDKLKLKHQEAERALKQLKADQATGTLLDDEFNAKLKKEVTEKTDDGGVRSALSRRFGLSDGGPREEGGLREGNWGFPGV